MPSSDMLTDQELFDAINERAADAGKAKEFAKTLRAKCPAVAQPLIDVGAGKQKGEGQKELTELQAKITELTEQLEGKDRELKAQPDVASIEEKASRKWEKKVRDLEGQRDDAEKKFKGALTQIAVDKAVALLITPNEQGLRTDREYAQLIAAAKLRDQIIPKEDGTIGVKQLGEESEYDGLTLDDKIQSLVKDYRAYVPATFQMSNADSGAGVRSGPGGVGMGPKKTLDQIIEQKLNDPALLVGL
jgi:hypothetical protein